MADKTEEQPHALTHAPGIPMRSPDETREARAVRRRCLTAAAGCTGALSRSFAVLLEALNRHRGKGQQKVTVEHVTVNAGGQAIVGAVATPGRGGGANLRNNPMHLPMHLASRCGARTRRAMRVLRAGDA